MIILKLERASLKREKNRLILANGSERGDFVPLDYIFSNFGRIHDGIQIMKTYYPNDEVWSTKGRVSEFTNKKNVTYAWDYEYDDYSPFDIFEQGGETLKQIEQIKYYGSDVHLTLTLDISLPDNELIKIVKSLIPFGKVFLRINHEANGFWFSHNTRHTYEEVSKFFVRFHKIIKSYSSNIFTLFSLTGDLFVNERIVESRFLKLSDTDLKEALNIADYWSIDKYVSLNYGWPFTTELSDGTYFKGTVDDWWKLIEETYLKMIWHNNMIAKPLFINEFASDSDVDGYEGQALIISDIYNRLSRGEFEWLEGIVLYQFRDYGGLGLEKGDLNQYERIPSLGAYKESIKKFKYKIVIDEEEQKFVDYSFYWFDSDSIRGLKISEIGEAKCFTNMFKFSIYVVHGEEQHWARLESGESMQLDDIHEFILLVPPFKNDKGSIITSANIKNITEKVMECFNS